MRTDAATAPQTPRRPTHAATANGPRPTDHGPRTTDHNHAHHDRNTPHGPHAPTRAVQLPTHTQRTRTRTREVVRVLDARVDDVGDVHVLHHHVGARELVPAEVEQVGDARAVEVHRQRRLQREFGTTATPPALFRRLGEPRGAVVLPLLPLLSLLPLIPVFPHSSAHLWSHGKCSACVVGVARASGQRFWNCFIFGNSLAIAVARHAPNCRSRPAEGWHKGGSLPPMPTQRPPLTSVSRPCPLCSTHLPTHTLTSLSHPTTPTSSSRTTVRVFPRDVRAGPACLPPPTQPGSLRGPEGDTAPAAAPAAAGTAAAPAARSQGARGRCVRVHADARRQ